MQTRYCRCKACVNPINSTDPSKRTARSPSPEQLLASLYGELRVLAGQKLARENSGQTLQATALVHEAWLRLGGDQQPQWQNRAQFFSAAAEAMRRILVDNARRKQTQRHGGKNERVA